MYDIVISYTTGSSFRSEEAEDNLDLPVSSLAIAKGNLQRIKEHYEKYNDSHDFDKRYELELLTDDGPRKVNPFWMGYFETLHGGKIISLTDDELSFSL